MLCLQVTMIRYFIGSIQILYIWLNFISFTTCFLEMEEGGFLRIFPLFLNLLFSKIERWFWNATMLPIYNIKCLIIITCLSEQELLSIFQIVFQLPLFLLVELWTTSHHYLSEKLYPEQSLFLTDIIIFSPLPLISVDPEAHAFLYYLSQAYLSPPH